MRLTDPVYNYWKGLVLTKLPAISSFLFVMSYIWDLPSSKVLMGFLAIVSFLLGLCLTISTKRYKTSNAAYDGKMFVVIPEDGPKVFTLELNGDPEELTQKESITFKILTK